MRISDWSSDVCSSDLTVDRAVEVDVQGGDQRGRWLGACHDPGGATQVAMNHAGRARGQRFRDRAPGEQAIRPRFHLHPRLVVAPNAGAVAVPVATAPDTPPRMDGRRLGVAALAVRPARKHTAEPGTG